MVAAGNKIAIEFQWLELFQSFPVSSAHSSKV
jgi:hypothetical protein